MGKQWKCIDFVHFTDGVPSFLLFRLFWKNITVKFLIFGATTESIFFCPYFNNVYILTHPQHTPIFLNFIVLISSNS